jgi:hypothetical protein
MSGTCSKGPLGFSVLQLLWYHLTPYFLLRQLNKTQVNTEVDPDDPELADEIRNKYSSG